MTAAFSTERTNGFKNTGVVVEGVEAEGGRFFGIIIGEGTIGATVIASTVNNVLDDAGPTLQFGHGLYIAPGAEDTAVIGFKSFGTAGHGILNCGLRTRISASACLSTREGKRGFYGYANSDMTLAPGCVGTIGADAVGALRTGQRQVWAPQFNNLTINTNGGSVAIEGTYAINDGLFVFDVIITPQGGATVESRAGATMTGLPYLGRPGVITAAFASAAPGIGSTGFTNGAGSAYLPTWQASAAPIILSGQFPIA